MHLRLLLNNVASQLLGVESWCLSGFKSQKTFPMEISEEQMIISEVCWHTCSPEPSRSASIILHESYSVVYNSIKANILTTFTNLIYHKFYFNIFPHSKEIFCNHMKLSGCYYWTQSASFSKKDGLFKKILTIHGNCWKREMIFGRVFPVRFFFFFFFIAILMKKLAELTEESFSVLEEL